MANWRQKWINAIKREDLTEAKLKYATVCSKHFINDKPAWREDSNNPDWVLSINLGYIKETKQKRVQNVKRFERSQKTAKLLNVLPDETVRHFTYDLNEVETVPVLEEQPDTSAEIELNPNDKSCQTSLDSASISHLMFASTRCDKLQKKLNSISLSYESFRSKCCPAN